MKAFAIDTETTGIDPNTDTVIEVALISDAIIDHYYGSLVYYDGKISSESKAVHHITEQAVRMSGRPRQEVIRDMQERLDLVFPETRFLVAHNAAFDRAFLPELAHETWVCTQRMAQKLLPELGSYGLQYLRYELDITTEPEGYPHQATYDTEVCLDLFDELCRIAKAKSLNFSTPEELSSWCWEPIRLLICPLGKHKGQTFEWIAHNDSNYLNWMHSTSKKPDCDWNEDLTKTIHYWYTEG